MPGGTEVGSPKVPLAAKLSLAVLPEGWDPCGQQWPQKLPELFAALLGLTPQPFMGLGMSSLELKEQKLNLAHPLGTPQPLLKPLKPEAAATCQGTTPSQQDLF